MTRPQRLLDIFVDPSEAAKDFDFTYSWILPWLVITVGGLCIGFASQQFYLDMIKNAVPVGTSAEQIEATIASVSRTYQVGVLAGGLIMPLKWLLGAALLYVSCVLWDVRVKGKQLFTLLAHCGLVLLLGDLVAYITQVIQQRVVDGKDDFIPDFSLNIFFHPKQPLLRAEISLISFFNIWYSLILILTFASMLSVSKRRAFLVLLPMLIFPFIFVLGVGLVTGN